MYTLRDFKTKKAVAPTNFIFTGETSPWEVVMDLERVRSQINFDYFRKLPPLVSKYLDFLPIKNHSDFVSLGEGATPLIRSKQVGGQFGANLFFKLESQNPTGSFKDRGSAVELTIARELGAKGIAVASTGNMAASCSCYAAAANIPCFVFVPEATPASKLSQVIAYGGRIVQVKGGYNDAVILASTVAKKLNFYLAGDYAFRVEGQKTAAFELLDQLFFEVPDYIFIPIGCGTNIAAYGKGFQEYFDLHFIDRIPKLIGVQAEGASPVVKSFEAKLDAVRRFDSVNTIATAIAIADPLDGLKALSAIRATTGGAIAVSDREILEAQYQLSRDEGLFVESSGAATFAAMRKMASRQHLAGKSVVCILTGGGLKDPSTILRVAIKPPTIAPEAKEFLELYNSAFFEGETVSFVDREEVVFTEPPEMGVLTAFLRKHLNATLSEAYLAKIRSVIEKFLRKGKPVTFADIQDIIQDALETVTRKIKPAFTIVDFDVQTGRDRVSEARVVVVMNGNQHEGKGTGAGPLDAIVSALKAAGGKSIDFALASYKLHVRSQGPDAVVYVEVKLTREGKSSVGHGTSPDILQASIEAIEEAYNGFPI